ncbi:peptidylprolyl isomerase [uncultured Roseobacter sp.]|uniref:peptidylprolyl isomerase n=1 Tax=uncultured Roseobacter sp. TaxID=114847 RepID=UPI002635EAE9|nr:peptidylprolyl isomerase [uncultured Roseobacter sp.]
MRASSKFGTAICLIMGLALGKPALAQGLFDPVILVNDDVVTEYEVEQRELFLRLLNAPGANREAVIESLVDERLRAQAVEASGLELTPEGIETGLEEFAARANMNKDEFISALQDSGVSEESFRDFVEVGIAWRDLIAARFGGRVQVSEDEIDNALGSAGGTSGIRVLVSEIIIPAPPENRDEVEEIAKLIAASESEGQFSEFAREYSATASRDAGGRLPWQELSKLPPVLRPLILALAPGEVTDPISIPEAVALFQLRAIEETGAPTREYAAIEYAAYYIPGGRTDAALSKAAKLREDVDVCDDLYGIAQGQPEEVLERGTKTPSEIPQDIAIELSKLDPNEISTALTRANGETLVFLMLCGRTSAVNEEVAREDVANALRSSRLNAYADSLLDQLRADARIVDP